MKLFDHFRRAKKKAEELVVLPSPVRIGYFNGECPDCKEHIGTYVWREYVRVNLRKEEVTAVHCPCCGKDIFEQVKSDVEMGRI